MKTISLPTVKLKSGMKVAVDVIYKNNIPYIYKDTVLNNFIIQRMIKLEIPMVTVYEGEKTSSYEYQTQQFVNIYDHSLGTMRDVFNDMVSGKKMEIQKVKESASHLVDMIMSNDNILGRMRMVRDKDAYTFTHMVNVSILAVVIGKWLKLKEEDLYQLASAGLLHDIGKVQISSTILNKPSSLTNKEFLEIKTHTVKGFSLLLALPDIKKEVALACLQHHERTDGSGYPLKLTGDEIHLFSKIVAIADIYDAMTSDRVYRRKVSPFKVAEEITSFRFGALDPEVCQVFLNNVTSFYVGNTVLLSNGIAGEVVFINPQNPTRPVVRHHDQFFDLAANKSLIIEDVLS